MPREREDFRENLERLHELFPGREFITLAEAATLTGACEETLKRDKNFPAKALKRSGNVRVSRYIVPLIPLARWMS